MSASRAAARSRFLFSGAGATVLLPPADTDAGAGAEREDAYLVAPAAHIGRVVTGVVLVAERGGGAALRELAASASAGAAARFGLTTVSFADKLAEQGYKVLVLDLFPGQYPQRASPDWPAVQRLAAAVKYLKQQHDVQRVGLLGVGAGADFAIKIAMERLAVVDCAVALSPHGVLPWTPASELAASQHGDQAEDVSKEEEESKSAEPTSTVVPLLLLIGEKTPYANSDAYQKLLSACAADPSVAAALKASLFVNQGTGFAFSNITDEDAATQAIAEILDWLVMHLHRFRSAACTSDADPWWPQGRNGPFYNTGARRWHEMRSQWLTPTQTRPPRPPPVPAHLLFDGLSSVRRTFELPQRMRLGDVIELFAEIWDVQQ